MAEALEMKGTTADNSRPQSAYGDTAAYAGGTAGETAACLHGGGFCDKPSICPYGESQLHGIEEFTRKLARANHTLSMLSQKAESHEHNHREKFTSIISIHVMPVLERLNRAATMEKHQADLDLVAMNLRSLCSEMGSDENPIDTLSGAEARVAMMVKNGLKSEQIARQFNVSLNTVKTHRSRIRAKLNIKGTDIGLREHLNCLIG